ncbi:MAG TPA: TetR/AcrR family transcriptional regulator [Methylomirabilota bacterium]|nr:TetR/AcrR family transcriptional regulator [Methylomirabilota bacterium]
MIATPTLVPKVVRPRARRLSPSERRAQLLTCALRVFARRGLGEARHAEIAKEAGVSVPTVFFYFPTRTDLVTAVLDEVERFYCDMADRVHGRDLPAPRLLLEHGVAFANSVDTHSDYARVWLDWSTAIRDEVWPRYLRFQDYVVKVVERTIRRGQREGDFAVDIDPEDNAHLMFGSAHLIAQMKFTRQSSARIERFLHTLVRIAIGGLPQDNGRANDRRSAPLQQEKRPSSLARRP